MACCYLKCTICHKLYWKERTYRNFGLRGKLLSIIKRMHNLNIMTICWRVLKIYLQCLHIFKLYYSKYYSIFFNEQKYIFVE